MKNYVYTFITLFLLFESNLFANQDSLISEMSWRGIGPDRGGRSLAVSGSSNRINVISEVQGTKKKSLNKNFKKGEVFKEGEILIEINSDEFNSITSSFRDLKRNELKLAESLKIKIYKVKKGDTYSSLSDKSPISYDPESKLRLLNGDYPDGKLLPGRLIKIVD